MTETIDRSKVLTRAEVAALVDELHRKARRSRMTRCTLAAVRLGLCGLRASEVCGVRMADVKVDNGRPTVKVRAATAKGKKRRKGAKVGARAVARTVPIWDAATVADLRAWRDERRADGAKASDPFVCTLKASEAGRALDRRTLWKKVKSAFKVLGERADDLTVHSLRHSFASHALASGKSLAQVRDACGHSSASVTNVYTHAIDDDGDDQVIDMFKAVAFEPRVILTEPK